jgi:hypothetical protein
MGIPTDLSGLVVCERNAATTVQIPLGSFHPFYRPRRSEVFRPRHWKGVRGQRHTPAAFYPQETPSTHCVGGWVGPRAGLDRCGKFRPNWDSIPRTVQPVANRYTAHTDFIIHPLLAKPVI